MDWMKIRLEDVIVKYCFLINCHGVLPRVRGERQPHSVDKNQKKCRSGCWETQRLSRVWTWKKNCAHFDINVFRLNDSIELSIYAEKLNSVAMILSLLLAGSRSIYSIIFIISVLDYLCVVFVFIAHFSGTKLCSFALLPNFNFPVLPTAVIVLGCLLAFTISIPIEPLAHCIYVHKIVVRHHSQILSLGCKRFMRKLTEWSCEQQLSSLEQVPGDWYGKWPGE